MSEPVPADPSTGVRQVRYDLFVMEEGATCQNRFQQTRVQVYARYAMTSLLWWRAPRVRTGSSRPEYMYTPGTVHYDLFVIEEVTPRVRTSSSRPEYRCTPGTL